MQKKTEAAAECTPSRRRQRQRQEEYYRYRVHFDIDRDTTVEAIDVKPSTVATIEDSTASPPCSEDIWYSKQDYADMIMRDRYLVRRLSAVSDATTSSLVGISTSCSSSNSNSNSNSNSITSTSTSSTSNHCRMISGLESSHDRKRRRDRMRPGKHAVFLDQERQWRIQEQAEEEESEVDETNCIAQQYEASTRDAVRQARLRGSNLEVEVQRQYEESGQHASPAPRGRPTKSASVTSFVSITRRMDVGEEGDQHASPAPHGRPTKSASVASFLSPNPNRWSATLGSSRKVSMLSKTYLASVGLTPTESARTDDHSPRAGSV